MAYIKNSVILKLNKKFMKRVRCPKCDNYITFDETKYENGQSLVFVCDVCNKQFRIRIGQSKLRATQKEEITDENENADAFALVSKRETFGVAYIEAMASGMPVLACRSGGPEDFIIPEVGMFTDDNEEDVVSALKSLKADRSSYDDS